MNEEQKKILTDEVNRIIQLRVEYIDQYYPIIRNAYKNDYDYPEFDPLREEICICIMFGLCQAAITLTNHFLESLLKHALIVLHGRGKKQNEEEIQGKVVTSLIKEHEEGIKCYGNANLHKTINRACTVGLISKEQEKQLHRYRERFRNAYGHSDKQKTFGKSTMPVTGFKLENGKFELDERSEPEIAKLLIGQGLVQAMIAQNDAPEYFLYIDSLARKILKILFDPE